MKRGGHDANLNESRNKHVKVALASVALEMTEQDIELSKVVDIY